MLKKIPPTILGPFLALILSLLYLNSYLAQQTGRSLSYWPRLIYSTLSSQPVKKTFLILGLDQRHDQLEDTQVTDTIIFASVDFKKARIHLISPPRDLWHYQLKSKINTIYPQSLDQDQPIAFIKKHFQPILGQPIDQVIILTTQNIIDFISLLRYVDVHLEQGFTDTKFPNPDYIKNPAPGTPVYITVSFPEGENRITKDNVGFFVRSRKSAPTAVQGGTDIGRIVRQQKLVVAIINKIKSNGTNFTTAVNLYNFFHQQIQSDINDSDLSPLIFYLACHLDQVRVKPRPLPVDQEVGVIYHPDYLVEGQWVFLPSDPDYQKLHQFIQQTID